MCWHLAACGRSIPPSCVAIACFLLIPIVIEAAEIWLKSSGKPTASPDAFVLASMDLFLLCGASPIVIRFVFRPLVMASASLYLSMTESYFPRAYKDAIGLFFV